VDSEPAPDGARFAVSNLRKNLEKIATPSIPVNRQRDLEHASYDAAQAELENASRMMKDVNVDSQALQQGKLQSWMHDWYRALTVKLREDVAAMKERIEGQEIRAHNFKPTSSTGMKDPALLLYLTLLPVEKLALITVLEIMRMAGSGGITDGMKALRGMLAVGRAVETEYRADTIKNVSGVDSPQWLKTIDPATQRPSRALVTQVWQRLGHQVREGKQGSPSNDPAVEADWRSVWTPSWPQPTHVGVGSFLIEALLAVAKVTRKGKDPETGEIM
jgi:DNA-directed RNA polymerase